MGMYVHTPGSPDMLRTYITRIDATKQKEQNRILRILRLSLFQSSKRHNRILQQVCRRTDDTPSPRRIS